MPTKLQRLRKEARSSAEWRGHVFPRRWYFPVNYPARQTLTCIRCGMSVTVLLNPQPNEIDIGGKAVALNCEYTYQEFLDYCTQDIKEIEKKAWLGVSMASHLRYRFKELTEEQANHEVNQFFLRKGEMNVNSHR